MAAAAAARDEVTAADVRRVTTLTAVAFAVLVVYWTLWFAARSAVASDTTASYYDFENAFPLADAWLALCLVVGTVLLRRRHRGTLLWFLLGAGGIELVRNENVELLAEDLYVSVDEVRVAYRFRNRTDAPVTYLVAFPLPDIDMTVPEAENLVIPDDANPNFVDFAVTVDGGHLPAGDVAIRDPVVVEVDRPGAGVVAQFAGLRLPLFEHCVTLSACTLMPQRLGGVAYPTAAQVPAWFGSALQ